MNNEIVALEFLNRSFLSRCYKSDARVKMDYVDIYGDWRVYTENQFLKVISAKGEGLRPFIEKNQINPFAGGGGTKHNRLKLLI